MFRAREDPCRVAMSRSLLMSDNTAMRSVVTVRVSGRRRRQHGRSSTTSLQSTITSLASIVTAINAAAAVVVSNHAFILSHVLWRRWRWTHQTASAKLSTNISPLLPLRLYFTQRCSKAAKVKKCTIQQLLYVANVSILGPGRRVPKSYSGCSSCSWNHFSKRPKIHKVFLVRSRAQRNFAYTFMLTLPTDLPSQIFHLFSN